MNREIAERILDIQEKAMADAEYIRLLGEWRTYDTQMKNLYAALSKEQTEVLMNYLGIGIALHLHLLELACNNGDRK